MKIHRRERCGPSLGLGTCLGLSSLGSRPTIHHDRDHLSEELRVKICRDRAEAAIKLTGIRCGHEFLR